MTLLNIVFDMYIMENKYIKHVMEAKKCTRNVRYLSKKYMTSALNLLM